jgi:hypothetical protein
MAPSSKETEKKADEKVEDKKEQEEVVEVKPVPLSVEDGQSASLSPMSSIWPDPCTDTCSPYSATHESRSSS